MFILASCHGKHSPSLRQASWRSAVMLAVQSTTATLTIRKPLRVLSLAQNRPRRLRRRHHPLRPPSCHRHLRTQVCSHTAPTQRLPLLRGRKQSRSVAHFSRLTSAELIVGSCAYDRSQHTLSVAKFKPRLRTRGSLNRPSVVSAMLLNDGIACRSQLSSSEGTHATAGERCRCRLLTRRF